MEAHRVGLPLAVGIAVVAAGAATFALRPRSELIDPAAVAGGALSVVLVVVGLPLSAISEQRARDFGLSTQDWGGWFGDLAKSTGIGVVFAALGGALLMALIRRFPRAWWAVAALAAVVLSAVFVSYGPVVIDPLFNKFTALPDSPLRSEVLALAHKDGVDVGQVY